jgi:hypothetical protein
MLIVVVDDKELFMGKCFYCSCDSHIVYLQKAAPVNRRGVH